MRALLYHVLDLIRTRQSLQLEVLVLRHQLAVYQQSVARPRTRQGDRILRSFLSSPYRHFGTEYSTYSWSCPSGGDGSYTST
jgi:transposase